MCCRGLQEVANAAYLGGFFSPVCRVLHRIAFPVVSERCQTTSMRTPKRIYFRILALPMRNLRVTDGLQPAPFGATIRLHLFPGVSTRCRIGLSKPISLLVLARRFCVLRSECCPSTAARSPRRSGKHASGIGVQIPPPYYEGSGGRESKGPFVMRESAAVTRWCSRTARRLQRLSRLVLVVAAQPEVRLTFFLPPHRRPVE